MSCCIGSCLLDLTFDLLCLKSTKINIHDCYVKYTMNPFTKIRSKVEHPCGQFEKGVHTAIGKYNEAALLER